jgi:hypothetical protein
VHSSQDFSQLSAWDPARIFGKEKEIEELLTFKKSTVLRLSL